MSTRRALITRVGVDIPNPVLHEAIPLYAGGVVIGSVTFRGNGIMLITFKDGVTLNVAVDDSRVTTSSNT